MGKLLKIFVLQPYISQTDLPDFVSLFWGQFANYPGRQTHCEGAGRNPLAWNHHSTRADLSATLDHCTVEDSGTNPDQSSIFDGTAMHDGPMPYYHFLPNRQRMSFIGDMQDRAILDICTGTYPNPMHIPPGYRVKPEGHVIAQVYVADHDRTGRQKDSRSDLRGNPTIRMYGHKDGIPSRLGTGASNDSVRGGHPDPLSKPRFMTQIPSRVDVVIPAYNEELSLPLVLAAIPHPPVDRVVVVDNNSTDATALVAAHGGAVVVHETRPGYGSACLCGLKYLRENHPPDLVVFLDADYSDSPEELPRLLTPILSGKADLVIGSRVLGVREPGALLPQARIGNVLACLMIRTLYGHRYTDLGPFRAIVWGSLEALGMVDPDFGWTAEMQVKALRHGLQVADVPVSYRKRVGVSKITGTIKGTVMAGYKIIWTVLRYSIRP